MRNSDLPQIWFLQELLQKPYLGAMVPTRRYIWLSSHIFSMLIRDSQKSLHNNVYIKYVHNLQKLHFGWIGLEFSRDLEYSKKAKWREFVGSASVRTSYVGQLLWNLRWKINGGPIMYNFFYRNFKAGAMQDPMTIIWGSFAAAVCAGCLTCRRMPAFELYEVCCGVVLSRAYIGAEVLCCLLPLVMAGVLTYFCRRTWCLTLPAILCGFLFGFSVYAFVGAFCTAGWVFAALLLAGRGICLLFLFWFLLRRSREGQTHLSRDLAIACCFSVLCILASHWLLSPVISELSQSVFIST